MVRYGPHFGSCIRRPAIELRVPAGGTRVLTFPADDAVFAERVAELAGEAAAGPDAHDLAEHLVQSLRPVHRKVSTSWRHNLAGFGDRVLYVFRDGAATSSLGGDDWISDGSVARVVTDPSGFYLAANEAAAELFGVTRDVILQARAGAFTEPDARIEDADALWRALRNSGRLHSLAVVCRPDGTTISVEFVTIRDGEGPDRHTTYLRALR